MVSWQVPHLSTGSRSDFNNDLGADSNNGPVLGPGVYLNLTQIMTPRDILLGVLGQRMPHRRG